MVHDDRPFLSPTGPVISTGSIYERIRIPTKYNYQDIYTTDHIYKDKLDIFKNSKKKYDYQGEYVTRKF